MTWRAATPTLDSLVQQAMNAHFSPIDLQTMRAVSVEGKRGPDFWPSSLRIAISITRTDRTARRRFNRLIAKKILVQTYPAMRWKGDRFIRPRTFQVHPFAREVIGNAMTKPRVDYEFRLRLRRQHNQLSERDRARAEQASRQAKAETHLQDMQPAPDLNVQDFLRNFHRLMLGNISVPKSHPDYRPQLSAKDALAVACNTHRIPQAFGRKVIDERRQHSEAMVLQFWGSEQKQGP